MPYLGCKNVDGNEIKENLCRTKGEIRQCIFKIKLGYLIFWIKNLEFSDGIISSLGKQFNTEAIIEPWFIGHSGEEK